MLAIYQIIQAEIYSKEFQFTDDELNDFWNNYVIPRKLALLESYKANLVPEPFKYNEDWECTNCPFMMHCTTLQSAGSGYVSKHLDYKLPESFIKASEAIPKLTKD